jgi:hypothetical protein
VPTDFPAEHAVENREQLAYAGAVRQLTKTSLAKLLKPARPPALLSFYSNASIVGAIYRRTLAGAR